MPPDDPNPRVPDDDSLFQGQHWLSARIVAWIEVWTPKCTEMTRLISAEMDRPLPWMTRLKMRVHYLMCCYCERYKDSLHYVRALLRLIHDHVEEMSAPPLPDDAKERIKRHLQNERDAA